MIMSEKPNDGTVAMHYGEIEDADYLAAEDYLPTLPNTVIAGLYTDSRMHLRVFYLILPKYMMMILSLIHI